MRSRNTRMQERGDEMETKRGEKNNTDNQVESY